MTFVDADGRPLNALCYGGGNTAGSIDVCTTLTHHHTRQDFDAETFVVVDPLCSHSADAGRDAEKHDAVNRQGCGIGDADAPAPACTTGPVAGVAYAFQPVGGVDVMPTIRQGIGPNGTANVGVFTRYAVRRLTPRECERLQGFPDDYTLIEYRGKPAADGSRYRALGNSMAVPVMAWIGRRIGLVDRLVHHRNVPAARPEAREDVSA